MRVKRLVPRIAWPRPVEQRVDKWRHWLEEGISNDIYQMHLQRFVWRRMHEIIGENEELKGTSSYFWDFLFDLYAKTQAGAVMRVEQSLLAESWNPDYSALGFDPDDPAPPFLGPAVDELAKADAN